jgi:hypothetical protein
MASFNSSASTPLRVFVKPGSKAEYICRNYSAHGKPSSRQADSQTGAVASISNPRPALNLRDRGGRIVTDLVYTNVFVGGSAWNQEDRKKIDENLAKAMTDQGLNNVLIQYFRGADNITSTFRASQMLPGDPPDSISAPEVKKLVRRLHDDGKFSGFDFENSLFNIMLPQGSVLTLGEGSGDEEGTGAPGPAGGETDEKATSLHGLGGFHGSVDVGTTRIYYAVGVFSEGNNGIVAFDQPWKNVVATFYHELVEARTDVDVETNQVAWVNDESPSAEIGDIPMSLARGNLGQVMKEVRLMDGSGTVPIQLMWSNAIAAPEGPISTPHRSPLVA